MRFGKNVPPPWTEQQIADDLSAAIIKLIACKIEETKKLINTTLAKSTRKALSRKENKKEAYKDLIRIHDDIYDKLERLGVVAGTACASTLTDHANSTLGIPEGTVNTIVGLLGISSPALLQMLKTSKIDDLRIQCISTSHSEAERANHGKVVESTPVVYFIVNANMRKGLLTDILLCRFYCKSVVTKSTIRVSQIHKDEFKLKINNKDRSKIVESIITLIENTV